jgi:hypothetical protein
VKAHLPVAWLPPATAKGTMLSLDLETDEAATQEGKGRVQSLLDSIGDQP